MLSDKDKKALQCATSSHTDEEYAALQAELDTERSMRHEAQSDYGNLMGKTEALEAELRKEEFTADAWAKRAKRAENAQLLHTLTTEDSAIIYMGNNGYGRRPYRLSLSHQTHDFEEIAKEFGFNVIEKIPVDTRRAEIVWSR